MTAPLTDAEREALNAVIGPDARGAYRQAEEVWAAARAFEGERPAPRQRATTLTHTHTYTNLFDTERVDALLGAAHSELETDFLSRADYMGSRARLACESRLGFLRAVWVLLLDRAPE